MQQQLWESSCLFSQTLTRFAKLYNNATSITKFFFFWRNSYFVIKDILILMWNVGLFFNELITLKIVSISNIVTIDIIAYKQTLFGVLFFKSVLLYRYKYIYIYIYIYQFIWLRQALVAATGSWIFIVTYGTFSCNMQTLLVTACSI